MPSVSRFLGIIIYMYYDDHNPPHFHVHYAEYKAEILIEDWMQLIGKLPPRVLGLVVEWAELHKEELIENWQLALNGEELNQIKPLL